MKIKASRDKKRHRNRSKEMGKTQKEIEYEADQRTKTMKEDGKKKYVEIKFIQKE